MDFKNIMEDKRIKRKSIILCVLITLIIFSASMMRCEASELKNNLIEENEILNKNNNQDLVPNKIIDTNDTNKVDEKEENKIDDEILKTYSYWVVFYDNDGNELQRDALLWGSVPSYYSDIPFYSDGEHWYKFVGWVDGWGNWIDNFYPIVGNTKFYAQFETGRDISHSGGNEHHEEHHEEHQDDPVSTCQDRHDLIYIEQAIKISGTQYEVPKYYYYVFRGGNNYRKIVQDTNPVVILETSADVEKGWYHIEWTENGTVEGKADWNVSYISKCSNDLDHIKGEVTPDEPEEEDLDDDCDDTGTLYYFTTFMISGGNAKIYEYQGGQFVLKSTGETYIGQTESSIETNVYYHQHGNTYTPCINPAYHGLS